MTATTPQSVNRVSRWLRGTAGAVVDWFERAGAIRGGVAVFLGFAAVYLATAAYGWLQSIDTIAAALPAWKVAEHGTLRVDEFRTATPWFVETSDGFYSNRFPGVIFIAVPAYAVAGLLGFSGAASPTLVPAAITAALVTAAAMGLLYVVFRELVPAGVAIAGVLVAGLGTGTWSVSGHALWTHGPAQLYLITGMVSLMHERWFPVGVAHGLAVFTRPQLAVVPFITGIGASLRRRSVRPAFIIGALSAVGLGGVVLSNYLVFGRSTVTGGYSPHAPNFLLGMPLTMYASNWMLTLVSPLRGLLFISPFLLASVPRFRVAWRSAPPWCRTSAIAGLAYMALQLRINVWHGGDAFFGYRLPIESLTLAAPILLISTHRWLAESRGGRQFFKIAVAWAIGLQAFGATAYLPMAMR